MTPKQMVRLNKESGPIVLNRKVWMEIYSGVVKSIPILFALLPLGVTVGLCALESNLKFIEIALMSAAVYTCIGQLLAIKMLASGSDLWSISIAVFLVSFRHLLMSATLTPYLKKIKPTQLALLAFGITDESFALGIHELRYGSGSIYVFMGIILMCWLSWVTSCLIGYSLGRFGGFFGHYVFEFTLPALLVCLAVLQIKDKADIVSALFSGVLAMIFLSSFRISLSTTLLFVSVLGASSGALTTRWTKK